MGTGEDVLRGGTALLDAAAGFAGTSGAGVSRCTGMTSFRCPVTVSRREIGRVSSSWFSCFDCASCAKLLRSPGTSSLFAGTDELAGPDEVDVACLSRRCDLLASAVKFGPVVDAEAAEVAVVDVAVSAILLSGDVTEFEVSEGINCGDDKTEDMEGRALLAACAGGEAVEEEPKDVLRLLLDVCAG